MKRMPTPSITSITVRWPSAEPDAIASFARAARGNLAAQREMIDVALNSAHDGIPYADCLRWAEMWARMAMANGDAADIGRMLQILGLLVAWAKDTGAAADADAYTIEGIALADLMADRPGSSGEAIGAMMEWLIEDVSPELIAKAKIYRETLS